MKKHNFLNFLLNNVNGLKSSEKRIKMFEYFREKISKNGITFLQETHSSKDPFNNWRNDFKGEVFSSHFSLNSCRFMIGYLGSLKFQLSKINEDDHGRILIVDASIDNQNFALINFYNANTESEQINTIYEVNQLLGDCYLDSTKKVVLAGDFNLFFDASLEALGGNPTLKKNRSQRFCN